ncbi:copper resistance CopC/CopD family protein [Nocardioides albidus]|uniref:copper resistance CopC/CopD family protein n=1 Tax=Nocardioides albidus TaxID=1517589 RepID=UPI00130516D7|nr:copper resistance protein CopC [Nocardioides albidus]
MPAYVLAVLATVMTAVLMVLGTAGPASAHATLVSTDPAEGTVLPEAPGRVTFTFDEPVQLVPDGLLAFDAQGRRVELDASARGVEVTGRLSGGLDDGTYVVTWRVVSADGHPIAGSLTFHVGAPSPKVVAPQTGPADPGAVPTVQGIVHGLDYAALLLAGGLAVFLGWTARGVRLPDEVRRRAVRVLRGSCGVAVLAAAVAVPLAGAYQLGSGLGGTLDPSVLDPALVQDDLLVLALHVLGLGVAAWAAGRSRSPLGADLLTALAVWSPALVGHTRAYEPSTLLVVTDALHLTAGAVWLGGLAGLALVLSAVAGRPKDAADLLSRFSALAAGLLAALAVTGVLTGWRIVGSWSRLVEETYGRLLLVKIALVVVIIAIAAYNRFGLVPRVARDGGHEQRRLAAGLVRRTVLAEATLLVAVLGVTGFLTQKPPGGEASSGPRTADTGVVTGVAGEDLKVLAVLDPGPGLQRRLIVQVQDLAGDPLDLGAAPAVALRSDSVDLGTVPVSPSGAGTYAADVVFPHTGAWELQVSVRVDTFTSPVTTVDLKVR